MSAMQQAASGLAPAAVATAARRQRHAAVPEFSGLRRVAAAPPAAVALAAARNVACRAARTTTTVRNAGARASRDGCETMQGFDAMLCRLSLRLLASPATMRFRTWAPVPAAVCIRRRPRRAAA